MVSNLSMSSISRCDKHQVNSFWATIKIGLVFLESYSTPVLENNYSCETTAFYKKRIEYNWLYLALTEYNSCIKAGRFSCACTDF